MAFQPFVSGTFNLGVDTTVTVIDDDTGAPISLAGRLISYKADPIIDEIDSKPIDGGGIPAFRTEPSGWTVSMSIDRAQGDLDSLVAEMEANFFANGDQKYFTIHESTRNANNNTIDNFAILKCTMKMETSGDRKREGTVQVMLNFKGTQRVPA